jgi:anti-sigma B factor antagonist
MVESSRSPLVKRRDAVDTEFYRQSNAEPKEFAMTPTEQRDSAPHVVCIEGEMTIYRAAEFKETMMASIVESAVIEFDLSRVTALDSAGVQILMLAERTARARHSELRLVAQSLAVLDVMELLNLGAYFGNERGIASRTTSMTTHATSS